MPFSADNAEFFAILILTAVIASSVASGSRFYYSRDRGTTLGWFIVRIVIPLLTVALLAFFSISDGMFNGWFFAILAFFGLGSALAGIVEVAYRVTVLPKGKKGRYAEGDEESDR